MTQRVRKHQVPGSGVLLLARWLQAYLLLCRVQLRLDGGQTQYPECGLAVINSS